MSGTSVKSKGHVKGAEVEGVVNVREAFQWGRRAAVTVVDQVWVVDRKPHK